MYRITVDYFPFLHNSQYDQDANDQRREFMCIFDFFGHPRVINTFFYLYVCVGMDVPVLLSTARHTTSITPRVCILPLDEIITILTA